MSLKLGSSPGEGRDYCTTTVGFQAPAANKTLCQGTVALSALGERDSVPVVLPRGAQRVEGAGSWSPNPAPCCATQPGQADCPLLLQPLPSLSCQVQPLQPKLLLTFKGRNPSPFWFWERWSFTTPALRSKDLLSSGNCFFFQPPAHSSHHSLHSCLPCSEGFTHPLQSPDSKTMTFG